MRPQRRVGSGNKYSQFQSNTLLAFGCVVLTTTSHNETRGKQFVVDSVATMHMETVRVSRSPTTVATANQCRSANK